jgi:hypothetical protein
MGTSLPIMFDMTESWKTVYSLIASIIPTSPSKQTLYQHPCILVGHVIDGNPVTSFNRRVLWLRLGKKLVETGDVGAVKAGNGDIIDVEFLGRVTAPLEGNIQLVQNWLEQGFEDMPEELSLDAVIEDLKTCIALSKVPLWDKRSIQLDIFTATVTNRMADRVFVFQAPSSF